MHVNPEIFKAYDIRGDFPEDINPKTVYLITRAFAQFLRSNNPKKSLKVVVASDVRPSSPELRKAVIEGLLEEAVEVIDMNFSTTPYHYYAVIQEQADGGIMVTASHNPFRSNGLKLSKAGAEPIGDGMEVVGSIARRGIFEKSKKGKEYDSVTTRSYQREYVDFLLSRVNLSKAAGLVVVADAGGGMTSLLLPILAKRLPCRMILLNTDLYFDVSKNPLNPSHEEHLAALKNAVIEHNADFGVAFDPDGDRSGFVTHNARFFRPDYMGAFLAREFLKQHPNEAIIYDVRSSSVFRETITAGGGRAIESRVGHRFIKELMKKENAFFAAELSGHFYFRDFYSMDSDFLSFLYFLQFLSESGKTSDELLEEFEIYPSSGELSFPYAGDETAILQKIASHFSDAKETRWVDDLSIYYDDWWANIRNSNTESKAILRIDVEARTKEVLDQKVSEIKALIEV